MLRLLALAQCRIDALSLSFEVMITIIASEEWEVVDTKYWLKLQFEIFQLKTAQPRQQSAKQLRCIHSLVATVPQSQFVLCCHLDAAKSRTPPGTDSLRHELNVSGQARLPAIPEFRRCQALVEPQPRPLSLRKGWLIFSFG